MRNDRYGREIPAGCKDVKLNLTGAWRTTYTHIVAGDTVRIQKDETVTRYTAAGTQALSRSYWAMVATVERTGRTVTLYMDNGAILNEFPHAAITRLEREAEYQARLATVASERAASIAESAVPLVTGHEAESHSRRGSECRICGLAVVDHADVNVNDGVAVSQWTGTAWGSTVNPERVAAVADRRVNAREAAIEADNARLHAADADGFLADAYAKLPLTSLPWSCMVHGDKFATMRELDAHIDAHLEYRADASDPAPPTGTGCDCNPGAHGSASHSPDCPTLVASVEAYADRRRVLAADLASLPPVAEQVASIRGNLTGDDLSMIDDARDLDGHYGRPVPLDPWSALRGKRKASKVTRRAWQSKPNRKGR